jgi:hypothetical protein
MGILSIYFHYFELYKKWLQKRKMNGVFIMFLIYTVSILVFILDNYLNNSFGNIIILLFTLFLIIFSHCIFHTMQHITNFLKK